MRHIKVHSCNVNPYLLIILTKIYIMRNRPQIFHDAHVQICKNYQKNWTEICRWRNGPDLSRSKWKFCKFWSPDRLRTNSRDKNSLLFRCWCNHLSSKSRLDSKICTKFCRSRHQGPVPPSPDQICSGLGNDNFLEFFRVQSTNSPPFAATRPSPHIFQRKSNRNRRQLWVCSKNLGDIFHRFSQLYCISLWNLHIRCANRQDFRRLRHHRLNIRHRKIRRLPDRIFLPLFFLIISAIFYTVCFETAS